MLENNLLPYDGQVIYYGKILQTEETHHFFTQLMNHIPWKADEAFIYGKHIFTKRKVAWFGDAAYAYEYSRTTRVALQWTPSLLNLKSIVESHCKTTYNSCLLNLYHHGEEGMTWHQDDEKTMAKNGSIASLSLGAERLFKFKHTKSKETININLETGSLLEMKGETQSHWWHALPKSKKVKEPRINLTFRNFIS
ncbi:MAG: alpha-ketoglutarate-dependent dioxygenase AlkB [Bacteroidota bacterium]